MIRLLLSILLVLTTFSVSVANIPPPKVQRMSITEDLRFLALTLDAEGRGEPHEGLIAIGWTILNRQNRYRKLQFKDLTIKEVVLMPFQYSCWNDGDPNLRRSAILSLDSEPAFLRSLGTAALLLHRHFPDPTNGSTNYHTIQKPSFVANWPPSWAPRMIHTVDIGAHRFYKERD